MTSRAGLKQTMHSDEAGRDREAAIQALYDEAVRLVVSEGHNLTEAGQRTGMTKEWVRRTIQSQGLSANSVEARRKEGAGAVQGLKARGTRTRARAGSRPARERARGRSAEGVGGGTGPGETMARDRRAGEVRDEAGRAVGGAGMGWSARAAGAAPGLGAGATGVGSGVRHGSQGGGAPRGAVAAEPGSARHRAGEVNLHGATLLSRKIGCFAGGYLQIEQGNELIFELEIDLRQETGGRKSLMCGGRPSDLCVIEAKIYG